MPSVIDKAESKKGLKFQMILRYLTGVLLDISYLPFVQNQNYQYPGKVSKGAKFRN